MKTNKKICKTSNECVRACMLIDLKNVLTGKIHLNIGFCVCFELGLDSIKIRAASRGNRKCFMSQMTFALIVTISEELFAMLIAIICACVY